MLAFLLLILPTMRSQEVSTPATLLGPKHYNHHPYDVQQYLQEVEPTKKGPVLFPNDAPPPPRPPLIVTSRPLLESIARSELNTNPQENNTIAQQSQINRISFRPDFSAGGFLSGLGGLKPNILARVSNYKPLSYPVTPKYDYGLYGDSVTPNIENNGHGDYETQTPLPPIYKVIADHAKQNVIKSKHIAPQYKVKEPEHSPQYERNDINDDHADQAQNYAFSYTVKDQKTGDDFSHSQHSSGSATNGEYRVRLPDGRMQIVSYTADENGYKADVRYDDGDKTAGNTIDNHDYFNQNNYHHDPYKQIPNQHHQNLNQPDQNLNQHYQNLNQPDQNLNQHYQNLNQLDQNLNQLDQDLYQYDQNKDNQNQDYNQNDYNLNKHDYINNPVDYANSNQDFVQNTEYNPVESNVNYKLPAKEDYNQYSDLSKEYDNNDYSLEYDGKDDNYEPHKSKFSFATTPKSVVIPKFVPRKVSGSTVQPSYDALKKLFVNKDLYSVNTEYKDVQINVPSTTPVPDYDATTTEHVVVIGAKPLYTNINNVPLSPSPINTTPISFVTPSTYLVSSIANLNGRIGSKPVLSQYYIDKINKYLTFNKK